MKIRHRTDLYKVINVAGNAAEIGVAEGYFSAEILAMPINFPRVYMVDRWRFNAEQKGDGGFPQSWHDKNLQAAIERVASYGERAVFLRGDSVMQAKHVESNTLALLYIDCDHSYEGVTADINAWISKVKKGGVVGFHDYENLSYGVKKAVQDFCKDTYTIHLIPEDNRVDAGAYFILC